MLQTSARLLRLLSLLQARRFWTGAELAERLAITERTVRRDVDRLRALGYPVNAASGVAGGYQLGAGAALPPLLLEDDEALAVSIGLRNAAAGSVAGNAEAAVRALAKLEQVLPPRLRKRVAALHASVTPMHLAGPVVDPALLTILAGACRDHERLRIRYGDRSGQRSERTIEPHGLVNSGARWYLAAFDIERDDWRTFRVDRVARASNLGRRFAPRPVPDGDIARYVSRSVASNVYLYRARVILHAPLAAMAEQVSPLTGRLEPLDAERCLLECGGNGLAMLGFHIAMLGVDFEVLEPPELADHLRTLAARMLRASKPRRRTARSK